MRRSTFIALALAASVAACSDSTTAPPAGSPDAVNFSVQAVDADDIRDLIEDLFVGGNENAALKQFRNIERQLGRGQLEDVRQKVFDLVDFVLGKLAGDQLDDPPGQTAAEGTSELVAGLFEFAGLTSGGPAIDPDILTGDRDGTVQLITPDGGTAVTASGFAAAIFPPGAVDDDVLLVMGRKASPCLPSDLLQAESCYEYILIPPLASVNPSGLFNVQVRVEQCLLPETQGQPDADEYTLHKFDPAQPQFGTQELEDTDDEVVSCSSFAHADETPIGYFARGLRRGIQRWFGPLWDPPALYAANRGLGGLTSSFSDISWAKSATIVVDAGDGQSASEFTTIQVSALVEFLHPSTTAAVGQTVTFTVVGGGGTVGPNQATSFDVVTDGSGVATVDWNLGPAGPQLVQATSITDNGPVTFNATALASGPTQSSFGDVYLIDGSNADGQGGMDEWEDATQIPLSGGSLAGATLLVQNDFGTLYMALMVPDNQLTGTDSWDVRFDATNDGVTGDDGDNEDQFVLSQLGYTDLHYDGTWGTLDSTEHGDGVVGNQNGFSFFEVEKPLFPESGQDFNVFAGETLGICIQHSDSGGPVADFPAGCATAGDQSGYLDIELAGGDIEG